MITINTDNVMNEPIQVRQDFTIMDLVPSNADVLKQILPEFDFTNPPVDPTKLASDLVETCKKNNGLGLSANQVGLPYRVFVAGHGDSFVAFFNPKIISYSDNVVNMQEGCLSFPALFLNIKRADAIEVEYQDYMGIKKTSKFTGITARVFQHELDHMNGIVYTSKVGKLSLEMATKRKKKHERMATRLADRILKDSRRQVHRV